MGSDEIFTPVHYGEPLGREVVLFDVSFRNRTFTREELTSFLNSCKDELDLVVERLRKTDEFSMISYDFYFNRFTDGKSVGSLLRGGVGDLSVGEFEKRHSLDLVQTERDHGYRRVFRTVLEQHDPSVPLDAKLLLIAYGDKITHETLARNPYVSQTRE